MVQKSFGIALGACVLMVAAWSSVAQEPQKGTVEVIKEKASEAVKSVEKGAASAGESIKGTFAQVREAAANMGINHRLYARLHWEKGLIGAKIETEVTNNGVATLRGTVPDSKAKAKAVELAIDTVGVTRVIDGLTILSATEPVPAKTP